MEQTKVEFKIGQVSIDRRDFLKKSGSLAAMGLFGLSFFTACDTEEETPNNIINNPPNNNNNQGPSGIEIDGNVITIDTSILTQLNSSGGWLLIVPAQTLVVNDGQIRAMTSICTHSRCDRNWSFSNNVFTCTCHGSRFNTTGQVLQGPANAPLTSFSVAIDGDKIIITK
jgi:cytochrome b6-f complex iron-sulfur subunit